MNCTHCGTPIEPPRRKFCSKAHKDAYYNKQNNYEVQKQYASRSPRNFLNRLTHKKAKGRDLSVDFLYSLWEKQEGKCALSGRDMTYVAGEGRVPTNVSIDRIDSALGYEEDNCQLVCLQANLMKQQLTSNALVEWCHSIVDYQERKKT